MDTLRQEDDWWRVAGEHFSVDNIRKYFALSPPFSAQDADRWEFPAQNGERFQNVRTRSGSLDDWTHGCLILP